MAAPSRFQFLLPPFLRLDQGTRLGFYQNVYLDLRIFIIYLSIHLPIYSSIPSMHLTIHPLLRAVLCQSLGDKDKCGTLLASAAQPLVPRYLSQPQATSLGPRSPFFPHIGSQTPTEEVSQWVTRSPELEATGNQGQPGEGRPGEWLEG